MDVVYLEIAETIGSASYAKRKKVGAILVKDKNIIAMGYNGTPAGFDNKCEIENYDRSLVYPDADEMLDEMTEEERKKAFEPVSLTTKREVLHAESNAIAKCARGDIGSEGATLYVTMSPCFECSKMIIQAGIKKVVFKELYRRGDGLDLLKKAGIETIHYGK